jgi:hypothetical protein
MLMWLAASDARAETRFGLFIGNNIGLSIETPLRWAESDARRVHDVMRELGDLPADNAVLLLGEPASVVRETLIRLNERIRLTGGPATLIVHYSGHADSKHLHLGDTALPLSELESLVRGSAATFRLLVLDACRSGALTRVKGGVVGPSVAVRDTDLVRHSPVDGVVFLTASSRDEDAQESDLIRGSFFTHYFASGLRGAADVDSDGAVDLDEAYRFAAEHTLRATTTSEIGPQHPTFRHEFGGRTTIVLTRLQSNSRGARLLLPRGLAWFVFGGSVDGPILAEVQRDDSARVVAVRGPRVFLRGRGKGALLEATIDVKAGEVVDAGRIAFTRTTYARLVRKGGGPDVANALELGYAMSAPIEENGDLLHGVALGFAHERTALTFIARLSVSWGGFDSAGQPGTSHDEGGGIAAGARLRATTRLTESSLGLRRAFDLDLLSLELGVSAGVAWVHQTFDWVGAAPDRHALAGRFFGVVAAVFDLTERTFLRIEGAAGLTVVGRERAGEEVVVARFTPRLLAAVGWRF